VSEQRAYVVVPFERIGCKVGPRQAVIVDAVGKARVLAQRLAATVPGVAVLERQIDPETGDGTDSLIAEFGAIPRGFPDGINWTLALN
jgi:hypothetical protein